MGKFKEYVAPYFDFFAPRTFEFNSKEELENKYKEIIRIQINTNDLKTNKDGNYLYTYDKDTNTKWVLGFVDNFDLKEYYNVI